MYERFPKMFIHIKKLNVDISYFFHFLCNSIGEVIMSVELECFVVLIKYPIVSPSLLLNFFICLPRFGIFISKAGQSLSSVNINIESMNCLKKEFLSFGFWNFI